MLREPRVEPEKQAQRPQAALRKAECPLLDAQRQAVQLAVVLPVGLKVLPAE